MSKGVQGVLFVCLMMGVVGLIVFSKDYFPKSLYMVLDTPKGIMEVIGPINTDILECTIAANERMANFKKQIADGPEPEILKSVYKDWQMQCLYFPAKPTIGSRLN